MKKILTSILFLCSTFLIAQPTCHWAYIPIGSTQSYNHIYNSTVDHSGNIIQLGMILGRGDMDPGNNPADTSFSSGSYNHYLSKTSVTGNLIWIHYFENNSQIASLIYSGLKVNSANEIVVAGNYTGLIDFDFSISGVDTLRSHFPTYTDYFVAKYDSAGNYKWAFNIGDPTTSNIEAKSITILSNDDIVVAANPNGTLDVDPGPGVHNSIGGNANIICYDNNGNYVWNNNISTTYSYGVLNNSVDGDVAGNTYLGTVGYYELTINKFDNVGARVAEITLGDFSNQARVDPQSIFTDKSTGDIYIAGTFGGTVDFDPGAAVVNRISSSGFYQDGFIAKYDQGLNLIWVSAYAGEMNFGDYSLAFDGTDLIAAGGMQGTIDFGNGISLSSIAAATSPLYLKVNASSGITQSGYLLDGYGQYTTLNACPNNTFVTTGYISATTDFDPSADTLFLNPGTNNAFTAFYESSIQNSVSENNKTQNIIAFPNPTANKIDVKISREFVGSLYNIYDITGRIVLTGKINSEEQSIKLDNLTSGIYNLTIVNNSKQTIRIVKE